MNKLVSVLKSNRFQTFVDAEGKKKVVTKLRAGKFHIWSLKYGFVLILVTQFKKV